MIYLTKVVASLPTLKKLNLDLFIYCFDPLEKLKELENNVELQKAVVGVDVKLDLNQERYEFPRATQ